MLNKIIMPFFLIAITFSLPATFDIRYLPSVARFANFDTSPDYFCSIYTWTKQLIQIVSNIVSVQMKEMIPLSTQHVAECLKTQSDICKQSTFSDILSVIDLIQNQGLVEQDCYPNNLMSLPSQFCGRKCANGFPFVRRFKALIKEEDDLQNLLLDVGNGHSFGFVVYRQYEKMNYYSPDNVENMKDEGDFYSYGIAEIVGWRKGGEQINLRMGASGWGFKGYGFVHKDSKIIYKKFSVRASRLEESMTQ